MLRVTVYENGSSSNGKVLRVCSTFDAFLEDVRATFNNPDFTTIYTARGGNISDVQLIR